MCDNLNASGLRFSAICVCKMTLRERSNIDNRKTFRLGRVCLRIHAIERNTSASQVQLVYLISKSFRPAKPQKMVDTGSIQTEGFQHHQAQWADLEAESLRMTSARKNGYSVKRSSSNSGLWRKGKHSSRCRFARWDRTSLRM
jgi:hypothetical protein